MNSILVSHPIEARPGFWGCQFGAIHTPGQMVFDVVFGVLMPPLCFYLDPGIVRGGFFTSQGEFSLFVYVFSALEIITLLLWIGFGHRMRSLTAIFGGVLVAGAAISVSIGVLILPLTLIGILFVIGLLGLVPFITGFVYLRNGVRAIAYDRPTASRAPRVATVMLAAVIAIGLPGTAQWAVIRIVNQSITEILDQSVESIDTPVARIRRLHLFVDTDRIVRGYESESNPVRKERLARAYKEITGGEIESRLHILND